MSAVQDRQTPIRIHGAQSEFVFIDSTQIKEGKNVNGNIFFSKNANEVLDLVKTRAREQISACSQKHTHEKASDEIGSEIQLCPFASAMMFTRASKDRFFSHRKCPL